METPGAAPAAGGSSEAPQGDAAPKAVDNQGAVPAGNDAASAEAAKAAVQKYKFKFQVDGKEVEEEYDEATLKSTLQKAKGADKRFQEAHQTQQKIARMMEMMKTPEGLEKILEHPNMFGAKAREVMEQLLWKKIQREQMDPKERENLELKERLREREEADKAAQEAEQQKQFEQMKKDYATQIDKDIVDAIKASGATVTPYFFKRVAHYMLSAMQQGKQVSPKDVVPLVKEDLQNDIRSMFETTSEEQILELLKSDKAWENIRKADLKRFKAVPAPEAPAQTPPRGADGKFTQPDANELLKRTSIFDY